MRRREFITLLGGAAATWPLAARAQQQATPVIGYPGSETPERWATRLRAFRQGLTETGYAEGNNVAIEFRWAEGRYDRFAPLAAELVRQQVNVIAVPGSTPGALAVKAATATIPAVFYVGGDPVKLGLVGSLNRPGGNLTGVGALNVELGGKQLELLHELVPTATDIALLLNPTNPALTDTQTRDAQAAARSLGLRVFVLHASTDDDIDEAFTTLGEKRAGALLVGADTFFYARPDKLAALAARYAVPTISAYREFAAAGGLMSYGGSITDAHHQVGLYTGRILKGDKPADLPVHQATKVELVINLKTARMLGLAFPVTLLGRADEVIE